MDIILGKERKRWSEDQKREIVAETFVAGEVTRVARRHGANPSMVFSWRKRLMEQPSSEASQPAFMPVALAPPTSDAPSYTMAPTLEVAFACGAQLRVTGVLDAELVAGIVKALKRA